MRFESYGYSGGVLRIPIRSTNSGIFYALLGAEGFIPSSTFSALVDGASTAGCGQLFEFSKRKNTAFDALRNGREDAGLPRS